MQFSLKSGTSEMITIEFHEHDVRSYCDVIGRAYDGIVPPLMCAKLWPKFKMFQVFKGKPIRLVRTNVEKFENLEIDMQYCAYLTYKSCDKIKQFNRFIFKLEINKNNKTCMIIEQTFVTGERIYGF
ncbi:protein VraC [Staphylococcus borealis]|uniref:protein VraC n=2 Tax=Staphylococcus borealis TaxID=2742203 RepID=UPI002A810489|nr:protein VraC [Staphylococcus borealis]MDY4022122.1 protein VraC [Staphylococcus borealis]